MSEQTPEPYWTVPTKEEQDQSIADFEQLVGDAKSLDTCDTSDDPIEPEPPQNL